MRSKSREEGGIRGREEDEEKDPFDDLEGEAMGEKRCAGVLRSIWEGGGRRKEEGWSDGRGEGGEEEEELIPSFVACS